MWDNYPVAAALGLTAWGVNRIGYGWGAFAVDLNNLALETIDGAGTMVAEIEFIDASNFKFKMIGDDEKDPGLTFTKN